MGKISTKFNFKKSYKVLLVLVVFLFSLFKAWSVFSASHLLSLESVSVLSKSETVDEGTVEIDGNKISSNAVTFHKVGDYIEYSVKIKNIKNENYVLKSISDDNENEYVSCAYENYEGLQLNSGESFDFVFKETYTKEVEDILERGQDFSVNFYFNLEEEEDGGGSDGGSDGGDHSDKDKNKDSDKGKQQNGGDSYDESTDYYGDGPVYENSADKTSVLRKNRKYEIVKLSKSFITGDSIEIYVLLAIVSFIAFMLVLKEMGVSKKIKKYVFRLSLFAIALFVMFLPRMAKNMENQSFKMALDNKIELKDKLIVSYEVDGVTDAKVVAYDTKVSIDDPRKEGYTFKGWETDDGSLFDLDTPVKDDIHLKAVFEADVYQITYNLYGGQAENPDSYTIEDEVHINNPSRPGYEFEGWTGTDISEITKDLVIPKGSMGPRVYDANWKANEYTVMFDANTGEGTMPSETFEYDVLYMLPKNVFVKDDFAFYGWNTQPDGRGDSYADEATVKNLAQEGTVVLYAQWGAIDNKATFIAGPSLNVKMKQFSMNNGSVGLDTIENNVKSIARSQEIPAEVKTSDHIVSTSDSPNVIYMWYDNTDKAIYYYSEADHIYFNSNSEETFRYFSVLESIDLNNMRTDRVTNMREMFYSCSSLQSLDLSGFITKNVKNMRGIFYACRSLRGLDLRSFNTSNVTDMASMFNQCNAVTSLNVSSFNTSKVTDMNRMFTGCFVLTSLEISNFDTSRVTSMEKIFDNLPQLSNINVGSFNTSSVKTMTGMFRSCPKLTTLNLSNFNTASVTKMDSMFEGCTNITSITINPSNFKTSNVTNMQRMFYECDKLAAFDFSGFNTSEVTNMSSMFAQCHSITELNLSSFNTAKVTNMSSMFNSCSSLVNLNVSSFDTRAATNINRMFSSCKSMKKLNVANFNTPNVTNMEKMFDNMDALTTIYASDSFSTASLTGSGGSKLFINDTNLVGGNGTVYNESNVNANYAHIDVAGDPGYFTSAP